MPESGLQLQAQGLGDGLSQLNVGAAGILDIDLIVGRSAQHLRTATEQERKDLLSRADDLVEPAILSALSYLSGLADSAHQMRRRSWTQRKHPEAFDRHGRLRRADDAFERLGRSFFGVVRELTEGPSARQA